MKAPEEPKKEDCCNSGCSPCIFDVYEEQLRNYEKHLKSKNKDSVKLNLISKLHYTTFEVAETIDYCKDHKLINFQVITDKTDGVVWWRPGQHNLVKYVSKQKTCSRAYTPLKLNNNDSSFSIIVKRYKDGLVSNYLFNLKQGEKTLWRGPYGSFRIIKNQFNRIIMIAQGTGIAPFMSLIEYVLNDEEYISKLFLCYCCQNVDQILFRNELYSYKQYWNFTYKIFLSDILVGSYKYEELVENKSFGCEDLNEFKPVSTEDQFLICGSEKFMEYYKNFLITKLDVENENIVTF